MGLKCKRRVWSLLARHFRIKIFDNYLERWKRIHGTYEKLLVCNFKKDTHNTNLWKGTRSLPCLKEISSFDVYRIIPPYILAHYVCIPAKCSTELEKLSKLKLGYLLPNQSQDLKVLDLSRQFNLFYLGLISVYFSQIAYCEKPL